MTSSAPGSLLSFPSEAPYREKSVKATAPAPIKPRPAYPARGGPRSNEPDEQGYSVQQAARMLPQGASDTGRAAAIAERFFHSLRHS